VAHSRPGSARRRRARAAAAAVLIAVLGSPASAQYFGRNKVRYRAFDFRVMSTEHFDIYFYPSEHEGAEIAARLAERWYARLERVFGHTLVDRQPLVLYASHAEFEQTNVVNDDLTEATGGLTEPQRRRIVLPLAGPIGDTDHVIGHELVHAFQFDVAGSSGAAVGRSPFARLPLWFVEGMAEYVSLGRVDANAAMKVRDAAQRNELPSIRDLEKSEYFPYQWGHAVFAYIAGRYGDQAIPRLLRAGAASGSAEEAISSALGISAEQLSREWHAAIRALYDPILAGARPLPSDARPAIAGRRPGSSVDIAPALSPDGRWIAFLSARDLFAIDLYVADARTGRVVRRLTSTASDPHYSSIQFVNSGAAWDPTSTRVAIGTIVGGRAAIAVFDVRTGRRERDVVLPGVDEALNPAWAPDGQAIAFTGMRQGLTDLYVYDFRTGALRPLTADAYADLHPAWSPDGSRIVFATDRYSSDLASMRIGALRLATIDPVTRAVQPVHAFDVGKHINPQWSRDGRAIYFIGNPDGVPNVYRLVLAGGAIQQITALGVGVSGITPSSPALSVSSSDALAVSTYEHERYHIQIWPASEPIAPPRPIAGDAAALPPAEASGAARLLLFPRRDPGLPMTQSYPSARYKASLSLDTMSQPTAGIGISSFGPIATGGAAFAFSDPLGDQLLLAAVQVGSGLTNTFSVNDMAYQAGYLRRDHRWGWGFVGGQIPYAAGIFERSFARSASGEATAVDHQTLYRETHRNAAGVLLYPFDRARRLELAAGVAQTSFERVVSTANYSIATGQLLSETAETTELQPHLNLATSGLAFVFDTTTFGPTSPVRGERYRLELAPTAGSTTFTGVLADYRRYLMPAPFYTIAARVLHYGRYGAGAEDVRLRPIFLNDPALVRGYNTLESVSVGCTVVAAGDCTAGDRLFGSRVLVGNVELRVPLLRPFGVTRTMYGPVPMELALFGDSGVAWNRGEAPAFAGGTRQGIGSAGFALRIGLGVAIAEIDVARPFQSSTQGWRVGFNLMPGW
jgi:Omp85 superfamily domain/Peptidase MA superfamily/WD40-like Beta Propeller Repeat